MKTEDRTTRHRNEVDGDEAKVVRLSDWLAPDDELVPFGPRAHAHAATRDPAEGGADPHPGADPPAASGFWDGDPAAHTAVPGPGIFDEPRERPADRRAARAWRPLRPLDWGLRACEWATDLVDRLSWRWAAAGVGFVALALVVLVIAVNGNSSDHHEAAAQASIGGSSRAAPSGTLGEIGTAIRATAAADLRRLPPVDTSGRTIGVAAEHARALAARHRRHTVVASSSVPSTSTAGSVQTPTTIPASAPAETTSAPAETEPVQTTSNPTSTTGSGRSASGGGSGSGSQKQPAFGAAPGSLGPGSSPNG